MMQKLAWLIASVLAWAPGAAAIAATAARPNFVVLVADDWGFSDVGAFGGEIATPNLDALAARGVRFSNFHVSASCSPTRAMLLTGVDNHKAGIGSLRESMPRAHIGKPGYEGSLNQRVVTVAELLRDSGYRTYVAGKWNVGSEPHNLPNQRGFERSIVQGDTGSDNWDPRQRYLPHSAKVYWFEDGREAAMPKEFYSSTFFADKAIEYMRSGVGSGKPFFTYVGFQANHLPVQAPKAFIDKYKGRYKSGWTALRQARRDRAAALGVIPKDTALATMQTTRDWSRLSDKQRALYERQMEVYAAMADAMDHEVGRLVAFLKETGEYDNTVFIFLSDNGAEASDPYAIPTGPPWMWAEGYSQDIDTLGGKGSYGVIGPSWASAAASPLSMYKFYAGEGGIRVPLIIAGGAGVQQGLIHHGMTHVTDIVPTLLDLAQVTRPGSSYKGRSIEPLTGASLLPALKGHVQRVRAPDQSLGFELSGNQALFRGDLKLVKNIPPVGDGQWHLFDIVRDPGETRDLKDELPAVFQAMQAEFAAYAKSHGVLPMPDGYDPVQQVAINTLLNYFVPRYGPIVLVIVIALSALMVYARVRRRRRAR